MDQKALFKQMLDFQKATFDNSFKAMNTIQEQGERMVEAFLGQATWLPEEGKKAVKDWIDAYKQGREEFKKITETNFQKVQDYMANFEAKNKDAQ